MTAGFVRTRAHTPFDFDCVPRQTYTVRKLRTDALNVRHTPRIFAFESLLEIEYLAEIISRILRLADEQAEVDECEHNVANIAGAFHAPMLEHEFGSYSETLQCECAAGMRQLRPGNVPPFGEPGLTILERVQHKQIRALVEPRFACAYLIHDAIAESQLSHSQTIPRWGRACGSLSYGRLEDAARHDRPQ